MKSCGTIMAEEINGHVNQPSRRVLGDYALQQGPDIFQVLSFLIRLER